MDRLDGVPGGERDVCDLGRRVDRLPHLDEGAGAEGLLAVEEQAHGHDADAEAGVFLRGFEDDTGGARLERLERGVAVARPLGEEGEGAALGQQVVGTGEGLDVPAGINAAGVRPLVLPAVDGDGAGEVEERAQEGDLPQGALGQEAGHHGQRPHQQQRVDQPVDVVGHQDQRMIAAIARDALRSHHLDFAEEDLEDQAGHGPHEAVGGHGANPIPPPENPHPCPS